MARHLMNTAPPSATVTSASVGGRAGWSTLAATTSVNTGGDPFSGGLSASTRFPSASLAITRTFTYPPGAEAQR